MCTSHGLFSWAEDKLAVITEYDGKLSIVHSSSFLNEIGGVY